MLIANPIYDTVFKYLLEDDRVARLFISTIIGSKVIEVKIKPKERTAHVPSLGVTVFRLDFAAVILTEDGERKNILIELQKADGPDDIRRFRRYIAENYYQKPLPTKKSTDDELIAVEESESEYTTDTLEVDQEVIPIITIYILGKPLSELKGHSAINIRRNYYDAVTGELIDKKEPFIECLTHDCHVIQLSELKRRRRNLIEQMFALFEQVGHQYKSHLKDFNEIIDKEFYPIIERLSRAALDRNILDEMILEDEIVDNWKKKERQHQTQIEEKQKIIEEKQKIIKEKQELIEEERRQREIVYNRSLKALMKTGLSEKEAKALLEKD